MDLKNLLQRLDSIEEAANPAQQAAIAVAMKKAGKKPKNEDSMSSAESNPTGPKFVGKMKGTDPASARYSKYVGENENLLQSFEREAKANANRATQRDLMREYKEFINEYGGVPPTGAASQAPQGTTSQQQPDPAQQQAKLDQAQIQKSVGQLKSTLNQQGANKPVNPVKFGDVMNKLDQVPNSDLTNQEQGQLNPLAVAASKIIQNPQTASQFKQLVTKADQIDQKKQDQVKQAQQQQGTNPPGSTATPSTGKPAQATGTTTATTGQPK